jgi:subtilisin family serine protease/photosystem II stability/assembly factor-like uncharacterized protein
MNKLFLTLIFFVVGSLVLSGAEPFGKNSLMQNSSKDGKNIAYFIYREHTTSTGKPVGSVIPIYRVPKDYLIPNAIHLKTKELVGFDKDMNRILSSSISQVLSKHSIARIRAPFLEGNATIPLATNSEKIENILELYFSDELDVYEVCKELSNDPNVEYAVPIFRRFLNEFVPNDPEISKQWFINNIQLPKAWEITKGNKKVVIAIIDSGVDWEHPDLAENIWTNTKEIPNNGVDDDGNGKIDDVNGWDFVGNVSQQDIVNGNWREDNNPKNIAGFHGTHVAGLASAVTNNGKGIASSGFSCSILPIKTSPDQGGMGIYRGYEAIVYAANMGAKIINCSWGGPGFSPAEQDIINYATNKGSLVVVASGNDGAYIDFGGQYPAGYDNVLCVGGTNSSNKVASFSNWGIKVTVYTPGQTIYSTMPNGTYSNQTGTSMSSPITAGVAGLVAALHNEWTPKQILHQIRSTSDNVLATTPEQRPYYYGKLNAYNAVYYNNAPGLEIYEYSFSRGSALSDYLPNVIQLKVRNYLSAASNVKLTLRPFNNYISLSQTTFSLGNISTNGETSVTFSAQLLDHNPWYLGSASILCTFESGNYVDYQLIALPIRIESQNKLTTVASFPDLYQPNWFGASSPQVDCMWAVGQGGLFGSYSGFVVVRPNNPGMNYISNQPAYCIYAFNTMKAIVGTGTQNQTNAYLYTTINGGQNWTPTNVSGITGFVNSIYFFDDNEGIFLGDPKNGKWGIGRTTDGGVTWVPITNIGLPNTNETGFVSSSFRSGDYLWFGTNGGRVFYSTDRGISWNFTRIPNAVIVSYLAFRDDLMGLAVYTESSDINAERFLATTTDGGKTWMTRQYNFTQNGYIPIHLFAPQNSRLIYVLCAGGEIFGTSDLGNNWLPVLNEYTGTIQMGTSYLHNQSVIRLWQLGTKISYLDFNLVPNSLVKRIKLTSENQVNYDTVNIGSNKLKSISIKNEGNVKVSLMYQIDTSLGASSDEFKFFGATPDSIAPGDEIQVRVRFVPKAEGLRQAKLILNSEAEPYTIEVTLSGYGRKVLAVEGENTENTIALASTPNPATDFVQIELLSESNGLGELEVYDAYGNKVFEIPAISVSHGLNTFDLDLEYFASGVYFVKVNLISKTYLGMFIKI